MTARRRLYLKLALWAGLVFGVVVVGKIIPLPGINASYFLDGLYGGDASNYWWLSHAWQLPTTDFTRMLVGDSILLGAAALISVIGVGIRRLADC